MTNTQSRLISERTRRLISERTRAALKELAKTRTLGRAPFGFKYSEGQLVPDSKTHATLKWILELHYNKRMNPHRITKTLNEYGLKSQTGKEFSWNVVCQIIKRDERLASKEMMKELTKTRTLGRPPFGFTYDCLGQLVPDSKTHATLKWILELHYNKRMNPHRITKMLNEKGLKSQTGKEFSRNVVCEIIKRDERLASKEISQ